MIPHWLTTNQTLEVLVLCALGLAVLAIGFTGMTLFERWRAIRRERHNETLVAAWEQPVLEVLNGGRTAESVIRLVPPRRALYFLEFLSRLARRLPGEERGPLVLLAAPFVDRLSPRLTHRDEAIRIRAVQTLSLLAFELHATKLLRVLDDRSALVALHAARALARNGHPEFAPPLVQHLRRFTRFHLPIVAAIVAGLGFDATPALLAAFADEQQPPAARAVLADALRLLHAKQALGIAAPLTRSGDPDLAAACGRLLRELGSG